MGANAYANANARAGTSIACVYVPHFALRIALLEQPELDGLPLIHASPSDARPIVLDCTPEASSRGVKPGMLLREVHALCGDAVFIQANPARETAAFEEMTIALETFSPLVQPSEPGCCHVDLKGLDRHVAGIEDAGAQLLRLISPILRPRVGIGPGLFSAWVAARQVAAGGVRVLPAAGIRQTLAPISSWWLPFPHDLLTRLDRLGLRTLGEIAALPRSAMQARFGPDGRRIWELANGNDDTVIQSVARPRSVVERLQLPAPIASRDMLLIGLHQLIVRAFDHPDLRDRHARQARLRVLIENNRSWEREMTFREPAGRERVGEILRHRLSQIELPGAAEIMVLELSGLVNEVARQELLPTLRQRRPRPLVDAARQLKQRYGASPLFRVTEVEPWSRIPERRHALISFDP